MNLNYISGIPNAPNNPSTDQPDMQTNTNNIPTLISVDHYGFANNFGGYHQQVHTLNQASPSLGTADGVLYAGVGTGVSQPFWKNSSTDLQILTGVIPNPPTTNGYFKVGSVMIQWGTNNVLGNATPSIPFSPSFSSACFVVFTNMKSSTSNSSTYAYNYAAANFTLRNGSGVAQDISWVAIGPA